MASEVPGFDRLNSEYRQTEFDALQNPGLGAVLLERFTAKFTSFSGGQAPSLLYAMPVLPIVFNASAVESLYRRQFAGGLYRALAEDRTITLGLHRRMVVMSDQTFEALNVAFASGLLALDPSLGVLTASGDATPVGESEAILKMLKTSERLGRWFSELSLHELAVLLDITF